MFKGTDSQVLGYTVYKLNVEWLNRIDILVPLRRPSWTFSNAAFVINLNPEVRAPEAANPAMKDCRDKRTTCKIQTLCPSPNKN